MQEEFEGDKKLHKYKVKAGYKNGSRRAAMMRKLDKEFDESKRVR